MKICDTLFIIFAAIFAVLNDVAASSCPDVQKMESECASYCYTIAKPLLLMAPLCHKKDQEISELKEKLAELQNKVAACEKRDSECKIFEKLEALENRIEASGKSQIRQGKCRISSIVTTISNKSKFEPEPEPEAKYPRDCLDVPNGILIRTVKLDGIKPFRVPCQGPGWMTIQRRVDDPVSFERDWITYKAGFGDLRHSFFIGLEKIYRLTSSRRHELKIKLQTFDGRLSQALYDNFRIGSEEQGYELLELGNYVAEAGDAGDALRSNVKQEFSTFDRDNDLSLKYNNNCTYSNLNGLYLDETARIALVGIFCGTWRDQYSLKWVEMLIRPTQ